MGRGKRSEGKSSFRKALTSKFAQVCLLASSRHVATAGGVGGELGKGISLAGPAPHCGRARNPAVRRELVPLPQLGLSQSNWNKKWFLVVWFFGVFFALFCF